MIEITGVDTIVADLSAYPGGVTRAMVRAMNRAMTSGRALLVRQIAADTGLSSTSLRARVPIREATTGHPVARIATSATRIPLLDFKARQTKTGVTYVNPGAGGRKTILGGFITTMRSGHRGVFLRRGKDRLPIDEKAGPSLGGVLMKFRPEAVRRIAESFDKNLAHELDYESKKQRSLLERLP